MDHILQLAYQHPLFTEQDLEEINRAHCRVEMVKGTLLLERGQVADHYYILESGLVRSYLFDYEERDITTGFSGIGDVVIEVASFFQRVPTEDYIQCLTDCVLWKISFDQFQELFHRIPAVREWGRSWMAYELYRGKIRATEMITLPAFRRYQQLLESHPQVLQSAPLKYIASFLGVTDTSLSRIRKDFAHQ
ncbi:MAG: Crp/Fnr family transcriptional regulator [Sphingobacteriales bacterium]|nr:MAG: Crp/Fnr family transcriptional regulator [Sphingobacteriales bacterium]